MKKIYNLSQGATCSAWYKINGDMHKYYENIILSIFTIS